MTKRRTQKQWQPLIEQQLSSGLSARQFCKHHNLGYASFCNWRRRLSKKPDDCISSEPNFLDLSSLINNSQPLKPDFNPDLESSLKSNPQSGWHIVLSLGNGVELRLSQNP